MGDDMIDLSAIPKAKDLIDQLGSKIIVLMRKEDDALHEVFRLKGTVKHLQDKLAKAVETLVAEREANLWNAYNIGIERDGRWSDACMSDAEWLVAQCGLDPEFKDHDANVIKKIIPTAARAVLDELDGEE